MSTKASAPTTIPATAQLRPGGRPGSSLSGSGADLSITPAPLADDWAFRGHIAVVAIYAGDEILAGGQAEKDHGRTEHDGYGAKPVGSQEVTEDAQHDPQSSRYDARPGPEERRDDPEYGQNDPDYGDALAPLLFRRSRILYVLAGVRLRSPFSVLAQRDLSSQNCSTGSPDYLTTFFPSAS